MAAGPKKPKAGQALQHPLRARIYKLLSDREASPAEIARALGLPVPNVSYHVRALASAGLIEASRTARRRGAVETYFKTRTRSAERRPEKHLTPSTRQLLIGPTIEAVMEGIGGGGTGLLDDPDAVFFYEALESPADIVALEGDRLVEWSMLLRRLEAESWRRGRDELRWYVGCALLGLSSPPPGTTRLSLVHRRGDELPMRPPMALPHTRALPPEGTPEPTSIVAIADAKELDLILHPMRLRILRALDEPASASELAQALGESVANVSYHMRTLLAANLTVVVGTQRRRGAVETYHRARYRMEISDPDWNALTEEQRRRFVRTALDDSTNSARAMVAGGAFDDPRRSVLFRLVARLDPAAAATAADALIECHIGLHREPHAEPAQPATIGAAFFATEPMPGLPFELRRHGGAFDALSGVIAEADPASDANPTPAGLV